MELFARRRARIRLIEADADMLMKGYGEFAYHEARSRSIAEQSSLIIDGNRHRGHWDRVRQLIGRREGRNYLDTATRYFRR
jgi:hypothetical protein